MKGSKRQDRVAQQVHREVSTLLLTEGHSQQLSRVVLTDCRVSADLRLARLYYTVLGDYDLEADLETARTQAQQALDDKRGVLRHRLGQAISTKYTPELVFHFDETMQQARRIEAVLDQLGPLDDDSEERPA